MTLATLAPSTGPITLPPERRLALWARPHRRGRTLADLLTVLDAIPAIGFAAGLAGALGQLAGGEEQIGLWLALALISLGTRAVLAQLAVRVSAATAMGVKRGVRRFVLEDLFEGRRNGAGGVSSAVEGVEALDGYFARFAALRKAATIAPLLIIAAVGFASPVAAGVLLFTLVPFAAGMALAGMAAAAESRRQFEALQRLSVLFLDRIRALPVLIAFQAESRTVSEIGRASTELAHRTGRVLKVAFLSSGVLEFFAALSVALVAVYCGFNLLRLLPFQVPETLTLTRAFFVLALAPEVYAPLRRLAAAYHDRQAAEAAVPALVGAADQGPRRPQPRIIWDEPPTIRFRDVEIRYEGGPAILSRFDLDVPAGAVVAITGASGSGKSSLLHLLLGLAPLSAGEVEIGAQRLSQIGDFAGSVGWASQAPIVVPGTLGQNIALAGQGLSSGAVLRAAGRAGLHGDLGRRLDERGGGLSGGERRRLGLARALLSESRVLVFDEPTANLDQDTETAVLGALRQACQGRTVLIATHSEAVLAIADHVVRL